MGYICALQLSIMLPKPPHSSATYGMTTQSTYCLHCFIAKAEAQPFCGGQLARHPCGATGWFITPIGRLDLALVLTAGMGPLTAMSMMRRTTSCFSSNKALVSLLSYLQYTASVCQPVAGEDALHSIPAHAETSCRICRPQIGSIRRLAVFLPFAGYTAAV